MGGKITGQKEFDLDFAQSIAQKFSDILTREQVKHMIVGSIRRKKPKVRDIDILVYWDHNTETFCRGIWRDQKNGKPKRSGLIDGINVELYPATEKNWIVSQATWTGSVEENIRLRSKAKRMGFTLSQNGFLNGGELVVLDTEQQLYEMLNEEYKEPENR